MSELACYTYSLVSVPLYDTLGTEAIEYIIDKGRVAAAAAWEQTLSVHVWGRMRKWEWPHTSARFRSLPPNASVWYCRKGWAGTEMCERQGAPRENYCPDGDAKCWLGQQGAAGWNSHPQSAGDGGQQEPSLNITILIKDCLFFNICSVFLFYF